MSTLIIGLVVYAGDTMDTKSDHRNCPQCGGGLTLTHFRNGYIWVCRDGCDYARDFYEEDICEPVFGTSKRPT